MIISNNPQNKIKKLLKKLNWITKAQKKNNFKIWPKTILINKRKNKVKGRIRLAKTSIKNILILIKPPRLTSIKLNLRELLNKKPINLLNQIITTKKGINFKKKTQKKEK